MDFLGGVSLFDNIFDGSLKVTPEDFPFVIDSSSLSKYSKDMSLLGDRLLSVFPRISLVKFGMVKI